MIDFKLMKHQESALLRSFIEPNLYLAWEPGTGKSCATIQLLRHRFEEECRMMRVLILAPKVVLNNWRREIEMYSNIPAKDVYVLDGSVKKRAEFFKKHQGFSAIAITNYDAMQSRELVEAVKEWRPEILVCDESHYLKSHKSVRARNVAEISDIAKHKYLLSGTPILNNALDLFMQYRILDGHLGKKSTFGHNFFAFRGMYFYDKNQSWSGSSNHFPEWVPREGAYKSLIAKIDKKTLRVEKKDCLDLPPLVVQNLEVELSKEQLRVYEEVKKYFISEITEGKYTSVEMALTKALRLQQIVSGFIKTDDKDNVWFKDNPRLDALAEQLEILAPNHKVIVWACFRENYKMISNVCQSLKIKHVELHGEVPESERQKNIDAFNNDESVRVLIGNQGAGGIGINLVPASYSIYYSRGFKLGDDVQSEARNYRRGSEMHDKVTRVNIVANKTIDKLIADALQSKIDLSSQLLNYIKEKSHEYGF
jgi:SNF2 family DNA or RNA helicase